MRTCNALRLGAVLAALSLAAPAYAFDPTPDTDTPAKAFRYGYEAYRDGDIPTALDAIAYAAGQGYTRAQWLLAQMYANGTGVARDDAQAFAIFQEIVNGHANDRRLNPDTPFVADAYVTLGDYYHDGLAEGGVNLGAAFQMYWHAATYLDDPEAQYDLAMMFLHGEVGDPDPGQAVRWANLAAQGGNVSAQALLGYLLFQGEGVTREAVFGLAYLQVALARTGGRDPEIRRMHEAALALATETERRTAFQLANTWLATNAVAAGPNPVEANAAETTDATDAKSDPSSADTGAAIAPADEANDVAENRPAP